MLKYYSINNDKYYSNNKRSRIKKSNSNYLNILPINYLRNNDIKPIKLMARNNTNYSQIEASPRKEKSTKSMKKSHNNSNISYKKYKTVDIDLDLSKISSSKKKRNKNIFNESINVDTIYDAERLLTQNENKFKRNVSQKIIRNKKISDRLVVNISILNNKIKDNYNKLAKSKYYYFNENKNIIETLFNNKRMRM